MRSGSCILALAVAGVLALPGAPASAQPYSRYDSAPEVYMDVFYESLAPYGEWVEMRDYGWAWAPRVDHHWRPYTRGQWVMTDNGWYWDSDERFGWATYHYGRWVNDRYYGWVWVPGTEWAPAWVSWRHGNGYTGWAPLPPRATWRTHVGLSIGGLDIDAFLGARDYAFVRDRSFVDRGIYQRLLPPTQNVTIINNTTNVTHYTVVDERIVDSGLSLATVEQALGRRLPRVRTVDVDRYDAPRRAQAGEVVVYRPEVRAAPGKRPAQGRSLVKGEQPPPFLVERRKQRELDRQQQGEEPDLSAKDVAEKRHGRPAEGQQAPKAIPSAQQERAQRQDADKQRAMEQNQQRLDREQQAADQQQKKAQQQQQQAERQKAQQQETDRQRAGQQNQQREQQAADQQQKKAQQQQQEADQQRAGQQQQQREQQAADQQQRKAQQQQQQAERQEAQQQQEQRADKQRGGGQPSEQAQTDKPAKDAPQEAKAPAKGKGKKKPAPAPSPSPSPAEGQQ